MIMINSRASRTKSKPIKLKVPRMHKPDDLSLEDWQRALRKQFGEQQSFILRNNGDHPIFSEFSLTNPVSGKTYRLAIRGKDAGENYCSCPDFSINNLGTCKHIEFTLAKLEKKPGAKKAFRAGFTPQYSEVFLHYGLKKEIRFKPGVAAPAELSHLARKYFDGKGVLRPERMSDFLAFADAARRFDGHEVRCYDDVMAFVAEHQDEEHRMRIVGDVLKHGIRSLGVSQSPENRTLPLSERRRAVRGSGGPLPDRRRHGPRKNHSGSCSLGVDAQAVQYRKSADCHAHIAQAPMADRDRKIHWQKRLRRRGHERRAGATVPF